LSLRALLSRVITNQSQPAFGMRVSVIIST
jgi:hypothetical protein